MQSIFPDVPREHPEVDKDGNFTELWSLYFGAISQSLQDNFKNEGIVIPPLSASNMAAIQFFYATYIGGTYNTLTANLPDISGQTVYDTTTSTTNQFVIAQDTNTPTNVTLAQWVPLSVLLTNAGNPNGLVAGVLNWLCYDTTNKILYICTTAGNSVNAVWQAI
jgi:hypothetical protein